MNLSWKNRFLESRDAVISQFRELSVILEEFSHQIDQARDITDEYEYILKEKYFKRYHVALRQPWLLEYENGRRKLLTARTTNGRCITSADAALIMERSWMGQGWIRPRTAAALSPSCMKPSRFLEEEVPSCSARSIQDSKKGEKYSGDNYTFCESPGNQVVMSLPTEWEAGDSGQESKQVVELTEQLLETGFSPRAALKLVNTVLCWRGPEQHPATLISAASTCIPAFWKLRKLGAVPTFIIGEEGVEIMEAGESAHGNTEAGWNPFSCPGSCGRATGLSGQRWGAGCIAGR